MNKKYLFLIALLIGTSSIRSADCLSNALIRSQICLNYVFSGTIACAVIASAISTYNNIQRTKQWTANDAKFQKENAERLALEKQTALEQAKANLEKTTAAKLAIEKAIACGDYKAATEVKTTSY